MFISADRPYAHLQQVLREGGVNVDNMHFVDAVSSVNGAAPANRPANATFLSSPTLLELLAMRVEQAAMRHGPGTHVILDSLDTLTMYNGTGPVQEFAHYIANRLRAQGVHGDFVARAGTDKPWRSLLGAVVDEHIDLPSDKPA